MTAEPDRTKWKVSEAIEFLQRIESTQGDVLIDICHPGCRGCGPKDNRMFFKVYREVDKNPETKPCNPEKNRLNGLN